MIVVYKAEDTKLKRTVALKFFPPDLIRDEEAKARFVHEAQSVAALQHFNICTIHDIDETPDNQLFIVMDCNEDSPGYLPFKLRPYGEAWDETLSLGIEPSRVYCW